MCNGGEIYMLAITNVANFIKNQSPINNESINNESVDAFIASTILSIAFCKSKEEVMADILLVTLILSDKTHDN